MIDELKSFIQVVDEQNFTKAAQKLNLSQPAVSMHISGLEKQLDTILILRSNKQKNFLLTPDGELLYKRAKKIVHQYEEMMNEIKSQKTEVQGTLKIGASLTIGEYLLPKILLQLSKLYPNLMFEVIIENSHTIMEKINQLELEIGLIEDDEVHLTLNRQPFYCDTLQIAYSDKLTLPKSPAQYHTFFSSQTWFIREEGSGTRAITDFFLEKLRIIPKHKVILGSNYLIKETLRQQLGMTFASTLMKHQDFKGISYLEEEAYTLSRLFYYVTKEGVVLSKRVQCMISLLNELDGTMRS
ncbi:CysJI operon transcriptional activator [Turicibacter sanguinis]|nr:CysJI operon transcriptional activator [Turicibacter sanguinis]